MARRKGAATEGKARRAPRRSKTATAGAQLAIVPAEAPIAGTGAPGVAAGQEIVKLGPRSGVVVPGKRKRRMATKKSERKKAKKGIAKRIRERIFGGKKAKKRGGGKTRRHGKRGASTSTALALYEAREIAPGQYEAIPTSGRRGRGRGRKSNPGGGGMVKSGGGRGGMLAKPRNATEYLTLGVAAVGGAPLGFWLQNQAQVPVPFTQYTIGRGSLATVVSFLATIFLRKRATKYARHTAALGIGTAVGVVLQKRATKAAESGTV